MLDKKKNLTFIEVCSGGGGLSTGLMKAGFYPLLLNDNNKDCCETLKRNHPNVKIVCSPMETIDFSEFANEEVDLLTGGVPCQSFSQAGMRKGLEDPRGTLMFKFIDILNVLKPKVFMIENVKGLMTHNKGETIKKIIEEMNKGGECYSISYKCLDSSNYGVPQKRERTFIVGVKKDLFSMSTAADATVVPFVFPKPTTLEENKKKLLKDVLTDVPASAGAQYTEEKKRLYKMIPQGGCWIHLPEDLQKAYLGKSFHSEGGKRGILYRLSMEKTSLTLLCTPSQKQTERCHPLEERPLTVREYARIQTFDDSYEFFGGMTSQYKQIGNAVPVVLAYEMGKAIRDFLLRFLPFV